MPWIYRVSGFHDCKSGMPDFLFLSKTDGSQEAEYLRGDLLKSRRAKKRSGAPRRTTNQVRRKAKS